MNEKFKKKSNKLLEKDLDNVSGGFRYLPKDSSDFKTTEEYEQYKKRINILSQEFDPRYKER